MRKSRLILIILAGLSVVSLATNYAALEKELSTAESSSQSNFSGESSMQQGLGQQSQQNIGRSIYDQNRGISQSQHYRRNNISTTDFGGQQKQQNIGRSIYDQNRESISQNQQRNNIKTTYFGDQQSQQNLDRSTYDQNREISQTQQGYSRYQGSNINSSEFGDQQRNSSQLSNNPGESLFEQNQ